MNELFDIVWPDAKSKYYVFYKVMDKETKKIYDDYLFRKGKKIDIDAELVTTNESWGKKYTDFHLGIGGAYHVNDKFINCMKGVGETNYQLFPIKVLPDEKPYYILNILNVIDCVDREKSKFTLWTEADERPDLLGEYYRFDKMVLDRSKIPEGVHLFRVYGYDIVAVITKELAQEFEKNKIKGFKLVPVG
jgi:hypothetical protein